MPKPPRPAPVPPGGALLPLEVPSGGFAPIVGVFVVILLSGLPNSILSLLSGRHAERSGWTVLVTGGEFISLQLARAYAFDEQQALGAAQEEDMIRTELRRELVRMIMERLARISDPNAAHQKRASATRQ